MNEPIMHDQIAPPGHGCNHSGGGVNSFLHLDITPHDRSSQGKYKENIFFPLPASSFKVAETDYEGHHNAEYCSGLGKYHSLQNKIDPRPYIRVTREAIENMAENPPDVPKEQAQWVILSTEASRKHETQRTLGKFGGAWLDIDQNPWGFKHVVETVRSILPGCSFCAYTTKGATQENQKCRVMFFYSEPCPGEIHILIEKILNDRLEMAGILPDRKSEAAGQICFLPNRGDYYRAHIEKGVDLNWADVFSSEIEAEKQRAQTEEVARIRRIEESKRRTVERLVTGQLSPIQAYNETHDIEDVLAHYGYRRIGRRYLSPNSASGSPGVSVEDGRWVSSHESDRSTIGVSGDAFDLYTFYEHGGNEVSAIKAVADATITSNGETITEINRRIFKESFKRGSEQRCGGIEKKTAGEIIKLFSDMRAAGEDIRDTWGQLLEIGGLTPEEDNEVIDYLVSQKVGKKRVLEREYRRLRKETEVAAKWEELKGVAGRRRLVESIPHDINQTTRQTEEAVVEVPGLLPYFDYGGSLSYATYEQPFRKAVGIDNEQSPKIPVIKQYSIDSLHLRVEQSVLHYEQRTDKEGFKFPQLVPTPQTVLHKMLDNPFSIAPRVSGLVCHPVLSLSGRVIDKEGIDDETGLLLQFGGSTFKTPGKVTRDNARVAYEYLADILLPEFDFRDEKEKPDLYRVTAIAFLLTGIFRKVIEQAPGVSIIASSQGTGKTSLARIGHVVLTGRDMPVSSLSGTPEEMQKSMLAAMLQSPSMICFDNILDGSEVKDPILAKVITSPYFNGRILGKSQEITVPTNSLIVLTGNNITLCADLVRRFLPIHLTSNVAQPEARRFKNPDIVQHCLNKRAKAVESCLTITKAYLDAGSPSESEYHGSSGFHQWDRMVRFPLLWATGVDILEAMNLNRVHSTEHHAMRGMMEGLYQLFLDRPFSATDLMRKLESPARDETIDSMRECVVNITSKALDSTRSLSWVLKKLVDRIIDGKQLKYQTNSSGNLGKYYISKALI